MAYLVWVRNPKGPSPQKWFFDKMDLVTDWDSLILATIPLSEMEETVPLSELAEKYPYG